MTSAARKLIAGIFPSLPDPALDRLAASFRHVSHPAQITLCHEGEIEDGFYVILVGRVDVFKVLEGQRLLVNHLEAGAHFGDIALLLDQPRSATIVTAEPTELLVLERRAFRELIHGHADIVVALSQLVIRRFLLQEEKQLTEIARLKKRTAAPATVFLSYARADQAFATRVANNLLKHGVDVWIDVYRIDPGRSWARQIGEALDQCQIMIPILSPAAIASENVDDEWNYFLDQKKTIVSVLHAPCKIPYRLSKLQYVDFHSNDHDKSMARLLATLNTL